MQRAAFSASKFTLTCCRFNFRAVLLLAATNLLPSSPGALSVLIALVCAGAFYEQGFRQKVEAGSWKVPPEGLIQAAISNELTSFAATLGEGNSARPRQRQRQRRLDASSGLVCGALFLCLMQIRLASLADGPERALSNPAVSISLETTETHALQSRANDPPSSPSPFRCS